jgi:hypothetical protein
MSSAEVAKVLESARQELKLKEKVLLKKKHKFMEELRPLLVSQIDAAIANIVSRNADRIEALGTELKTMKNAIDTAKTSAVESGLQALESCPDWLQSSQSIDGLGVTEQGRIWQSLQSYSNNLRKIMQGYGLTVDQKLAEGFFISPLTLHLASGTKLQEINESEVAPAHRDYCNCQNKVASLEEELKAAKAREKYESV